MQIARTLPSSSGEISLARADAYASARWAFGQAARRGPMHTCDLRLAGRHVRLQVARRALFDCLRPAIGHLETQPAHPRIDLTINLWDVADTGVPLQVPINIAGPFGRDRVEISEDGRLVAYVGDRFTGWLDRDAQQMYVCFPSARYASLRDRAKPLHHLLAAWHLDRHVPLVHGSVIARSGAGVLLAGNGDTGASIASLSCALAGFDYLGDDTIGLEPAPNGSVTAHSVYCSATIDMTRLDRYPSLAPHAVKDAATESDSGVVLLNRLLPRPLTRTATLAAIVIPRINGYHRARLSPASRVAAQAALTPTIELASPAWHTTHAALMAIAVDQLPCYWMEMGPDATRVPECLGSLLDVTQAEPLT